MLTLLKRPLEAVLASHALTHISRTRVRGLRLILAYHGIVPDGAATGGERALFLAQRDFASQLDMLSEVADVASLDELDEEGNGRPRVAITMDDAYRGAVREGVGELVARSLPATIFVAPGRLNGHTFWWDSLATPTGGLSPEIRDHALHSLNGSDERVRAWAERRSLSRPVHVPTHSRAATFKDIREAVAWPGITVGSHSWSHANLASLDASEISAELARSRSWLANAFGDRAVDWLAYPYGLESLAVRNAAESSGYEGALCIQGGWHRVSPASRFARPRLNVPAGLSVDGLRARVLGSIPT